MSDDRSAELSALCSACGLCCDGTMFHHVELRDGEELAPEARRRLRMVPDSRRFLQPCSARSHAGCDVYTSRPKVCRTYRCSLLRAHEEEGGDFQARLDKVTRARALADRLRALAATPGEANWLFDDLATLLERDLGTVPDELKLDVAELGMRLQRDFGRDLAPQPK